MKILFDARVLGDRMHGIARYCLGLLGRLLTEDRENEYLVLISREEVRNRFPPRTAVRWIRTAIPLYGTAEQILLPLRLVGHSFDLYHSPTFTLPLFFSSKGMITLHDLIPLLFPDDYGVGHRLFFRFVVRPAVLRAQRVITVSRRSAEDIKTLLKVPEEKIAVTPNGLDPHWSEGWREKEVTGPAKGTDNYILFVGNPKPHKNFQRVLAAFQLLKAEENYPGRLVVVGLSQAEIPASLKEEVRFLPRADDHDLARLYARADLLASPSLYEGFGLPVLEAMACGCPVLIGDRGALPEVAGEAGFSVNPWDIRAIKKGMRELIFNTELRAFLSERGKKRAAFFTWERTAQQMQEVYREYARCLPKDGGDRFGFRKAGREKRRRDSIG